MDIIGFPRIGQHYLNNVGKSTDIILLAVDLLQYTSRHTGEPKQGQEYTITIMID